MEVELKIVPEQKIAYTQHKGSYEDLRNSIATVTLWVLEKCLKIIGHPVGMHYPVYELYDELFSEQPQPEFEVGIPFTGNVTGGDGMKIMDISGGLVLSSTVKNIHGKNQFHDFFIAYALDNGFEIINSPMEIYLNDIMEVSKTDLLTEVQLSVFKKPKS